MGFSLIWAMIPGPIKLLGVGALACALAFAGGYAYAKIDSYSDNKLREAKARIESLEHDMTIQREATELAAQYAQRQEQAAAVANQKVQDYATELASRAGADDRRLTDGDVKRLCGIAPCP